MLLIENFGILKKMFSVMDNSKFEDTRYAYDELTVHTYVCTLGKIESSRM